MFRCPRLWGVVSATKNAFFSFEHCQLTFLVISQSQDQQSCYFSKTWYYISDDQQITLREIKEFSCGGKGIRFKFTFVLSE